MAIAWAVADFLIDNTRKIRFTTRVISATFRIHSIIVLDMLWGASCGMKEKEESESVFRTDEEPLRNDGKTHSLPTFD